MAKLINIAPDGKAKRLINLDNVAMISSQTLNQEGDTITYPNYSKNTEVTLIQFNAVAGGISEGTEYVSTEALETHTTIPIAEFIRRCREEVLVI